MPPAARLLLARARELPAQERGQVFDELGRPGRGAMEKDSGERPRKKARKTNTPEFCLRPPEDVDLGALEALAS